MTDNTKEVFWLGDSKEVLKSFPRDVVIDMGAELRRLQIGEKPIHWKPFKGLDKNAFEIKVKGSGGEYRTLYVTYVKGAIVVVHCFQKKTQKTAKEDINIANQRIKEFERERKKS